MLRHAGTTGLFLSVLLLGSLDHLEAQAAPPPLPTWHPQLPNEARPRSWASSAGPLLPVEPGSRTHSHTWTGLLIGGLVGGAATAVFLAGFCGDPDTQCGADEVGRAVVIIAVPAAAAGALIGSLIRTKD
jgi:hypothetical protein